MTHARDLYELSRRVKDPFSRRLIRELILETLPPWLRRIYTYAAKHSPVRVMDVSAALGLNWNAASNGLNQLAEVGLLKRRRNRTLGRLQWTVIKENRHE